MEQKKRRLSDPEQQKVCDTVYVSLFSGLSLSEYTEALMTHCSYVHSKPCHKCERLLHVAGIVLEQGYCSLSKAFSVAAPGIKYNVSRARSLLLQMPLVSVGIGNPAKGCSFTILMEKYSGVDYAKMGAILNGLTTTQSPVGTSLEKSTVKMLLSIAKSDRERECVRYAVYKASGMTPTSVRRLYGFERMQARATSVEAALSDVQQIREAITDLANIEDESVLARFGIEMQGDSSTDESDEEETLSSQDLENLSFSWPAQQPCDDHHQDSGRDADPVDMKLLLEESKFNWFEFVEQLHCHHVSTDTEKLFNEVLQLGLDGPDLQLVKQSHLAYLAAEADVKDQTRTARAVNGEILTESESDDPEAYVGLTDVLSEAGKSLVAKKRAAIRRRAKRRQVRAVAERRFLSRKISKRTSRILKECPDIVKTIEKFVQERNVGADMWRRTGVLTFDGNTRLKQKATYEGIRRHLEEVYHRKFGYGTVVQLCIPRNKRRISAKRYQGLAKVTSRRARKGFTLKFNPDAHWSAAFYKGLNALQYADGRDLMNINRDDATGFRLDTLSTCKQYTTPVVQGKEVLTTRTDFVNRYPSVLQTTSYNFTSTSTTGEVCAGVIKAPKVHQKNPAQHAADLELLESKEELSPVFVNGSSGLTKSVECVRVDGASDEGPSHEEVQFWWAARHLAKGRVATLVTTRSSGSSYLNRVELQNGCLSLGHASTFIPSTLAGSCMNTETGMVDNEKLRENLNLAIDAYISRVDGTPCGNTPIHLYKGARDSEQVRIRDNLLIFLKGAQKSKRSLLQKEPAQYAYFKKVWDIRSRHMVPGLPSQYVFMLVCCYKPQCCHPVCKIGPPPSIHTWYSGGPPVTKLPLPVVDLERPWGGEKCQSCEGTCSGHYKTVLTDVTDESALRSIALPPSTILKEMFSKSRNPDTTDFIQEAAEKALLNTDDTRIWLQHLQTVLENRKRGAAKAAVTRQAKKATITVQSVPSTTSAGSNYHCGKCGKEFIDETDQPELWIGCDMCDRWYCSTCEGLNSPPDVNTYICSMCR